MIEFTPNNYESESRRRDHEPYLALISLGEANPDDTDNLGGKAANLARLVQNGLCVPEGYVVPAHVFDKTVEQDNIPRVYLNEIMRAISELGGAVAIRSSANVEDGEASSLAGVFETHYVKDVDSEAIEALILGMYKQARSAEVEAAALLYGVDPSDIKLGIVVQKLIEPIYAGVIYVSDEGSSITVQYIDDFGERLVDGVVTGSSVAIDRGSGAIVASSNFDSNPLTEMMTMQLVVNAERITDIFDSAKQDIEFAIDKEGVLHILQARPLTREIGEVSMDTTLFEVLQATKERAAKLIALEMNELGTERVVLSLGNFSELLPNPAPMDAGTFQYVFSGYNGRPGAIQIGRQKMGYPIGDASVGYMHYIGGQVYESLGRDAGSYYVGFPETEEEYFNTLVREYLDTVYADSERASYPEMGLYLQDPSYDDLEARFGAERALSFIRIYKDFKENIGKKAEGYLSEYRDTRLLESSLFINEKRAEEIAGLSGDDLLQSYYEILEHMRNESCVDFVTAARLGFYYMQNLKQTLISGLHLPENQTEELLSHLSQGLDGSSVTNFNIEIAQAATDDEAYQIALRHIYHYPAEGEVLQIRHQRMGDNPDILRQYVEGLRSGDDYTLKFAQQREERVSVQRQLLKETPENERAALAVIIERAQQYMALRETVKDQFTREYALLRERLVEIERRSGMSEGQIFYLYPDEIFRFPNLLEMKHLADARTQELSHYSDLDMPSILRHDTVDDIREKRDDNEVFTEVTGQFIAPGEAIDGVIVNMDEFNGKGAELMELIDKVHEDGDQVILAALQINLTHDPFINRASGLVIERAGFVSHGAQRARELGVGALSSIAIAQLKTGMRVFFDPANKRISNREDV